ncbi:protocadherin-10-like [Protopterus annectens]|uniref:protocadherin-10-like n=1 Tax=Protopterus annectens TaxID=7888 RepID=UPI001CFB4901|nr:protocadherin-10-like [Protopterus annectens]
MDIANLQLQKTTKWRSLILVTFVLDLISGQIRYTIPEELEHGAFVGNIAEDLGIDVSKLSVRRFRIVSGASKQYLEVNLENGILFVNEKIDREELCEASLICFLHLQVVIEHPLELFRVEVEILDVNDNAPSFPWDELVLEVTESAAPGSRFPLESAQDPDVGANSLRAYQLSPNQYFALDTQTRSDGSKFAELVLERHLDREHQRTHQVTLTALDGGLPERSGTAQIIVRVLDANDNVPTFDHSSYRVTLQENIPKGTLVIKLNATDLDEGTNGEIVYAFSGHAPLKVRNLFTVDPQTGEVRVKGIIDHEKARSHELYIQARDKGPSAVAVHCKVLVDIIDLNDNAPEVILTSVSNSVQEDTPPGTVIAVISVMDRDSGENGHIECEIPTDLPFQLHSTFQNYYTLVTNRFLDREVVPEYNITLTARDLGLPPLVTRRKISVQVSDVNDNPPRFLQPSYTVYVTENNAPGTSICSVSAFDPDSNQNAYLSYFILEGQIQGMPVSTYVSINSDSGHLYALRSFDYEHIHNFQIQVQAQDAGFPSLNSNVTINVFILDQNDNAPVIVSPLPKNGSVATEVVPRFADPGYLVGKISATDADSGQNSRLSYQILQASDSSLFSVALYTGEIRTLRELTDRDSHKQMLSILVKDSGQPPLSASVSILLSVVDNMPETFSDFDDTATGSESYSNLTLYLIISLSTVSFTFLVAIIVLTAIKCQKDRPSIKDYRCSLSTGCCIKSGVSGEVHKKSNINLQISSGHKVPTNCVEVSGNGSVSQGYCYKVCLTPESAKSDFMFLKPYSSPTPQNNARATENNLSNRNLQPPNSANNSASQLGEIKQPNTDWLVSKTQNSGPSRPNSCGVEGNEVQKAIQAVQRDSDKIRSLSTPVPERKSVSPSVAAPTSHRAWTPRYGAVCTQSQPPQDYQHNVYIPGTPTVVLNKHDGFTDPHSKNSFSTFGKKKKFITNSDKNEDYMINNELQ